MPQGQFYEDLPEPAKQLLEQAQAESKQIQAWSQERLESIRQRLQQEENEVRKQAAERLQAHQRQLIEQLKPLQREFAQQGLLDEALAIREQVRLLGKGSGPVQENPGNLLNYSSSDIGKVLRFRVTGTQEGAVWGTNPYTTDSRLARAAVHAGAINVGATGIVTVELCPGQPQYAGSHQNGVTSSSWGSFPLSFKILL